MYLPLQAAFDELALPQAYLPQSGDPNYRRDVSTTTEETIDLTAGIKELKITCITRVLTPIDIETSPIAQSDIDGPETHEDEDDNDNNESVQSRTKAKPINQRRAVLLNARYVQKEMNDNREREIEEAADKVANAAEKERLKREKEDASVIKAAEKEEKRKGKEKEARAKSLGEKSWVCLNALCNFRGAASNISCWQCYHCLKFRCMQNSCGEVFFL